MSVTMQIPEVAQRDKNIHLQSLQTNWSQEHGMQAAFHRCIRLYLFAFSPFQSDTDKIFFEAAKPPLETIGNHCSGFHVGHSCQTDRISNSSGFLTFGPEFLPFYSNNWPGQVGVEHFCTRDFLHTRFYTQKILHKDPLHKDPLSHRGFHTQTL